MRMTSVRNAAAAVLAVGLLSGCQSMGVGCEEATVQALEAQRVGDEVVMTAEVTRGGEPVEGIGVRMNVHMEPDGRASAKNVGAAATGAAGIARERIAMDEWNARLEVLPAHQKWFATITPDDEINGVLYCWTDSESADLDPKLLPEPVGQPRPRSNTPGAGVTAEPGSVISSETLQELESDEPLTIPEPGEDPGFDD